jgi:hypothetical protein
MPRYYFHICEGDELIPDIYGMNLRDLREAKQEVMESALDLVRNRLDRSEKVHGITIEIADATGKIVDSINVREFAN